MEASTNPDRAKRCPFAGYRAATCLLLFACFLPLYARLQCPPATAFYEQLISVEQSGASNPQKLLEVQALTRQFDRCRLPQDSVYARLLHRTGVLQSLTGNPEAAISSTWQSIRINTNGKPGSNRKLALQSYYNLGTFCLNQERYPEALEAFGRCVQEGRNATDSVTLVRLGSTRKKIGYIYHYLGDFQKDLEVTTQGLQAALPSGNRDVVVDLYNEQAQAHTSLYNIRAAISDLDQALRYIRLDDWNALADNNKLRAEVMKADGDSTRALEFYKKTIEVRKKAGSPADLAKDYLDAGNLLRHFDPAAARLSYTRTLALARQAGDSLMAAKALNNLGLLSKRTHRLQEALQQYNQSLAVLIPAYSPNKALLNLTYRQTNGTSKVFLYQLLANKAECLLALYKKTNSRPYLHATVSCSLLTDSVISGMRREQTDDASKLIWLKDAKEFFAVALEACFLSADPSLAFFFMEKSRSVLLNEKLNELGAQAKLPMQENALEKGYQHKMISEQQLLWKQDPSDPQYQAQESRYLAAKELFENYIRSLQTRFPVYYQYKYADNVPAFATFRQQIKAGGQSFVHFFVSDTCVYALATAPDTVHMIRQCVKSRQMLSDFLRLCADKQAQNRSYTRFTELSHRLYQIFFAPLNLRSRHVTICNDNFLLPFEALSADAAGKHFLIRDYVFSYAYSARSQMKKSANPAGKGDCLLVAPGACETGAGVSAAGEGVYSLARGFAAAGVPAIASTLWKADAGAMADIARLLNQNISRGMRTDDALQQAKLTFMQHSGRGRFLPYYWANIILAGSTEPIRLDDVSEHFPYWTAWGGIAVILLISAGFVYRQKTRKA